MEKKLLSVVLWSVALIRASVIVACLAIVYAFCYVVLFGGNFSKTESVVIPCIVGGIIFLCLLASDTNWVEKNQKN